MPTWNSEQVLEGTLDKLAESASFASVTVNRLILIDNLSEDDTISIARHKANEYAWELALEQKKTSLPAARELAIRKVQTPWFLFLDDDVRLSKEYLGQLTACVAPAIGAVQGRKLSSSGKPWEWVQRRVYRGGTHATLIRTEAVRGISIPEEIEVLEDEYIRRHVESRRYLWLFNHQARFRHDSMERHSLGWEQGCIAGKYNLMPFYVTLLFMGDALASGKALRNRISLMLGWLYGRTLKK